MAVPPELARLFAYTYQAAGRRRLLEEDIVRLVAHERRWLSPSKVRSLVQAGRESGLLRGAGAHALELAEEFSDVRVPIDYRPDAASLDSPQAAPASAPVPLFRAIVRFISEKTGRSESEVVAAVNSYQEEVGGILRAEVAAIVVARLYELDASGFYAPAEDHLRQSYAKGHR